MLIFTFISLCFILVYSVILYFVSNVMGKIKRWTLISESRESHREALISSQRIVCLQRYLGVTEIPWKVFLCKSFCFRAALIDVLSVQLTILYKECLVAWSESNSHARVTTRDVLNVLFFMFLLNVVSLLVNAIRST